MWAIKLIFSSITIVVVSELAKRTGWLGGLIASLPLVSVISITWLYIENKDVKAVCQLSYSILWFILPSLVLFLVLPLLLKKGMPFYSAILISLVATMGAYAGFFWMLQKFGIEI